MFVQDGVRRRVNQVLPIIDAFDPHSGWKDPRTVDPIDFLLHPHNSRRALLAAPHEHDPLHDVVIVVFSGNAEAAAGGRPRPWRGP